MDNPSDICTEFENLADTNRSNQDSANIVDNIVDTGICVSQNSSHIVACKRSASPLPNTALKKFKPSVDTSRKILSRDEKESDMRMLLKNVPYDVSNLSTEKYNVFRSCILKIIDCVTSGKTFEVVTECGTHSTQSDSEKQCADSISVAPEFDSASVQSQKNVNLINLKLGNQPIRGKPRGASSKAAPAWQIS